MAVRSRAVGLSALKTAGCKVDDLEVAPRGETTATFAPTQPGGVVTRDQPVRRFYYVEMFVVLPVFVVVGGAVCSATLSSASARPVGIIAATFVLVLLFLSTRANFVASVYTDGTLTFRSLTRSVSTNLQNVTRISVRSGGRGTVSYLFYFGGESAALGGWNGKALARYVVGVNPAVDIPRRYPR
jgi:hypothetical protein